MSPEELMLRIEELEKKLDKMGSESEPSLKLKVEYESDSDEEEKSPIKPKSVKISKKKPASNYRSFVSNINSEPFMKKFKGNGKRRIQSLLYELLNDIEKDELDRELFDELIESLCSLEINKDSARILEENISEYRGGLEWTNLAFKESRK